MGERIRVALLGYGRIGRIHFRSLVRNPRVELRYVVDEFPENVRPDLIHWGLVNTKIVTNKEFQEILDDKKFESLTVKNPLRRNQSNVILV